MKARLPSLTSPLRRDAHAREPRGATGAIVGTALLVVLAWKLAEPVQRWWSSGTDFNMNEPADVLRCGIHRRAEYEIADALAPSGPELLLVLVPEGQVAEVAAATIPVRGALASGILQGTAAVAEIGGRIALEESAPAATTWREDACASTVTTIARLLDGLAPAGREPRLEAELEHGEAATLVDAVERMSSGERRALDETVGHSNVAELVDLSRERSPQSLTTALVSFGSRAYQAHRWEVGDRAFVAAASMAGCSEPVPN